MQSAGLSVIVVKAMLLFELVAFGIKGFDPFGLVLMF